MPRRSRINTGGFTFHVINRAVHGAQLFSSPHDYESFLHILADAQKRTPIRIYTFAVMPTHWHLVLSPYGDGELSTFMRWLTVTHAQRRRTDLGTRGRGAVYQGRYKAIAVQDGHYFIQLCHYVERNARRAGLVAAAEDWPWTSASPDANRPDRPQLAPWPVPRPADWSALLNAPESPVVLDRVRTAIREGKHFGTPSWRLATGRTLKWTTGLRGPGREWEVQPAEPDGAPESPTAKPT
jgi:putative transposase